MELNSLMPQILTFGEILFRLQSCGQEIFESTSNRLKIYPGGSEANVAVSLSKMGNQVQFVSALPDNVLAKELIETLTKHEVDCSKIISSGDRIGSYLLLSANGLTSGEVVYDRKYSSFSMLHLKDLNFDLLFEGVEWFHWSALTPALSYDMALLMEVVLKEAHAREITISVDLNYRSKLWQYGKRPLEIMPRLVAYCDVIMGNIWAAHMMLGSPIEEELNRNTPTEKYLKLSKATASYIFERFPQAKHVANTFRFMDHAKHNLFYGTYHSESENRISPILETEEVIDRIGSGDAFMAGLIHALRHEMSAQEIINFATAAGYQKLFVEGDFGNGKAI